MKYVKYAVLFVILVLIGFVSINFYQSSKLDSESKSNDTKTEEKDEIKDNESTVKDNEVKGEDSSNQTSGSTNTKTGNASNNSSTTNSSTTTNSNSSSNTSSNVTNNGTNTNNTTNTPTNSTSTSKGELVQGSTANNSSTINSSKPQSSTSNSNNTSSNQNSSNSSSPVTSNKNNSSTGVVVLEVDPSVYSTNNTTNYNGNVNTNTNNNSNGNNSVINNNSINKVEEIIMIAEGEDVLLSGPSKNDNSTSVNSSNNVGSNNSNTNSSNNVGSNNSTTVEDVTEKIQEIMDIMNEASKQEEKEDEEVSNDITLKDGNLVGATGYTALNGKKYLRAKATNSSKAIVVLKQEMPFRIISTTAAGTWWKVNYNGKIGYVESAYCMINLPDYIPSITYKITNASSSLYKSSGVKLSVTGEKLYETGKVYNSRLGKKQFIVPVMYGTAQKILKAQTQALKDGYSLKIYDAYRPVSVDNEIKTSLSSLYRRSTKVRNGIDVASNGSTWGKSWFIAENTSSHSYGVAIDVSLTKKGSTKVLNMPSRMHELSTASVKYKSAVTGKTIVREDLYASSMTSAAKRLDRYMLNAGFTNLASEWWHFQDNATYDKIKALEPNGLDFEPTRIVSKKVNN